MDLLLGFLSLLVLISTLALIVGLIKPSIVMFWAKNPARWKVFLLWLIPISLFSAIENWNRDDNAISFGVGNHFMEEERYDMAISSFKDVEVGHENYDEAQRMIKKADSLKVIQSEELEKERLIAAEKEREEEKADFIERLDRELDSKAFKEGLDEDTYRGSIAVLQLEVALFTSWAKTIEKAEQYEDDEIKRKGKSLKAKVQKLQVKEFPKMRKEYARILKDKLWEEDIEVKVKRSDYTTLDFTGAIFARNKNIKEFESTLSEAFRIFRFKRVQYRWMKYADEYTYYELDTAKDNEIKPNVL